MRLMTLKNLLVAVWETARKGGRESRVAVIRELPERE